MDDQKEEIENLRKQIKSLKIGLMLTQISTGTNRSFDENMAMVHTGSQNQTRTICRSC